MLKCKKAAAVICKNWFFFSFLRTRILDSGSTWSLFGFSLPAKISNSKSNRFFKFDFEIASKSTLRHYNHTHTFHTTHRCMRKIVTQKITSFERNCSFVKIGVCIITPQSEVRGKKGLSWWQSGTVCEYIKITNRFVSSCLEMCLQ